MNDAISPNLRIVLDILRDEVRGDVASARAKMHEDFTVTYMYKDRRGHLFPSFRKPSKSMMTTIYAISDRSYEIRNYAEHHFDDRDVVFVEFIERYTDPNSGRRFQTPIVIVLELEGGKIKTNRHYCDNDVSFSEVSPTALKAAYKGTHRGFTIN